MLREFLDDFISAYIDDIIIYLDSLQDDYQRKVKKVLDKLHDIGLQYNINKSAFERDIVKYLVFIIYTGDRIYIDPAKVEVIYI